MKELIAGVDEVGRGPLAGPLVVAGVILNGQILGLDDSKKLSKKKIRELDALIKKEAKKHVIWEISVDQILELGIKGAVHFGMIQVIKELEADYGLIDYEKIDIDIPSDSITKGDQNSNSIAAASIIAKKYRDD